MRLGVPPSATNTKRLPPISDMVYEPSTGFDGAKYMFTPALHATMWECRMSAIPACVKALNKSKVAGWFEI